jgi:hypothetical protein
MKLCANIPQVTFEEVTRFFMVTTVAERGIHPLAGRALRVVVASNQVRSTQGRLCVMLRRGISRLAKGHPNTVPFFAPLSSTPPGLHEQRVRVRQSLDASAYCSL